MAFVVGVCVVLMGSLVLFLLSLDNFLVYSFEGVVSFVGGVVGLRCVRC